MNVPRDLPAGPETLDHIEFLRDLTPYVFLADAARGKRVLEIGVGSGHGCWMLRRAGAQSVTAVDLDTAKVARAVRLNAGQGGVFGVTADAQHLPFRESCFDLVTCFEVIEHVPDPERLLAGIRHTLREDGVALALDPERQNRLLPLQKPWNPEHRFEYRLSGFRRAVQRHFESPQFLAWSANLTARLSSSTSGVRSRCASTRECSRVRSSDCFPMGCVESYGRT